MTSDRITFAKLRQYLTNLGYTEKRVPGKSIVFLHSRPESEIILPVYRSNQDLLPAHLVAVRSMLDGYGLATRDEFNRWLEDNSVEATAAG